MSTRGGRRERRALRAGSVRSLDVLIGVMRTVAPEPGAVFPAWQGMQYTRDMFSGRVRLGSLDNDRYPGLALTSVEDKFARGVLESAGR